MHLVLCPGGLPPLPLDLGPARGVGVLLDYRLLRTGALSLRWLLRELAKGELLGRSGLFFARYAPRLSLTIPRRTLDDVGNCGRLWRTAPACYPLVVPDLRIVEHGGIRELIHGRVVFVDRGRLSSSRSPSRSRSEVEGGHRRGRSLPLCGRVAIDSGLLTAAALDVCGLILGETGLDPWIDTALGVPGRGLLTATGHIVSVCVPLPAGEIGVTARGHTLSRSRGQLPASPAHSRAGVKGRLARRDQQEGAEAVVSQPPAVSEVSVAVTPAEEELFFRDFRLLCRILPGSF